MGDLKILIVEDDLLMADRLAELLLEFGYIITDTVHNSTDAFQAFRKRLPDLVLMDINLEHSKLDGIELAHKFNKVTRVPLIFLTGIGGNETAKRAQEASPANYLIKPYNRRQLEIAIDLALSNFVKETKASIDQSFQYSTPPPCIFYSNQHFFFAKKGTKYIRIEIADILWVEANAYTVTIHTEYTRASVSANLSSFLKQVQHPSLVRVHRSHVVNINKVVAFDGGRAFVKHRDEQLPIPIGATFRDQFQQLLPRLKSD